jgi:hypothetical protein
LPTGNGTTFGPAASVTPTTIRNTAAGGIFSLPSTCSVATSKLKAARFTGTDRGDPKEKKVK